MTQRVGFAESATEESPSLWGARAAVAERGVVARHLRRVWALPGTRLGVSGWPQSTGNRLHSHWNYWWQAHLLDCLVDAQERQPNPARAGTITRLVRGIRLRNLGSWTNDYYDDIAWLGLALMRAHDCEDVPVKAALTSIAAQLRAGWTDHGGGGIWWRRKDNFKNVPANGPAAILFARWATRGGEREDRQRARSMTEWMSQVLVDPATGLLWDGVYVADDGSIKDIVKVVYTYCQGVYIGACVELAAADKSGVWEERAGRTINAVAIHLNDDKIVRGRGGGDGGLFAGILARYLAQAALRLPSPAADTARADEETTGSLLTNLMRNAIEAMHGSTTRILRVSARAMGDRAILTVTDTGPGIRADILARLFEPFVTSKPAGAGLGLGLVIAAQLVRAFGGTLRASNNDEGGACFVADLPSVPQKEAGRHG